jgi:hypothetical protein
MNAVFKQKRMHRSAAMTRLTKRKKKKVTTTDRQTNKGTDRNVQIGECR